MELSRIDASSDRRNPLGLLLTFSILCIFTGELCDCGQEKKKTKTVEIGRSQKDLTIERSIGVGRGKHPTRSRSIQDR
jgi:hypothetical protein